MEKKANWRIYRPRVSVEMTVIWKNCLPPFTHPHVCNKMTPSETPGTRVGVLPIREKLAAAPEGRQLQGVALRHQCIVIMKIERNKDDSKFGRRLVGVGGEGLNDNMVQQAGNTITSAPATQMTAALNEKPMNSF